MKSAKMSAIVLAVAVAGLASMSVARADEMQAKSLLERGCPTISPPKGRYSSIITRTSKWSAQQQKVGLASSGTLVLNRPDKLRATRTGGFANVEMVFDGKTLTLLGRNTNLYTQVARHGTIDHLVDVLQTIPRPVPAADLLMSDPYNELMPLVTDVKDLGSGVIHGVECDHLALGQKRSIGRFGLRKERVPIPAAMLSPVRTSPGGRNIPSMSRRGRWALR